MQVEFRVEELSVNEEEFFQSWQSRNHAYIVPFQGHHLVKLKKFHFFIKTLIQIFLMFYLSDVKIRWFCISSRWRSSIALSLSITFSPYLFPYSIYLSLSAFNLSFQIEITCSIENTSGHEKNRIEQIIFIRSLEQKLVLYIVNFIYIWFYIYTQYTQSSLW